ncbi:MAG: protein-L-isoaspartate O-methyltransferase [Alphaproteobacteria bacterium]
MTDFAQQRFNMVESQVRPNNVTDPRIAARMHDIPREQFVPKPRRALAYVDEPVLIADGRYLIPAMQFSKLLQLAGIEADDSVLVVGCGLGYGAAIAAGLAESVIAVDEDEALVAAANDTLADLGIDNAAVVEGVLSEGMAKQGPYDVIFVEGAVSEVPQNLLDQLADGGRLVAFLANGTFGKAVIYTKTDGHVGMRQDFDAVVPPLPGFEKAPEFAL